MTARLESIVSVGLQGGLGNQMFQYAAGHALARRIGAQLRLDLSYFDRFDKRRYLLDCYAVPAPISTERSPTADRGRAHAAAIRVGRRLGVPDRLLHGGWNVYVQSGFHFDMGFEQLAPPVHLDGYFQSELYFRDVADEVRGLFKPRVAAGLEFAAQRDAIAAVDWAVSIHVRRGDYLSEQASRDVHGICGDDYYRRAIALCERLCAKPPTYFVFSDDGPRARELLRDVRNAVYVTGDPARPWEDMALMAACRGHIIANSSFSWWGAWLDPRTDGWVIAPRQWFTPVFQRTVSTADVYCDGWIVL